MFLYRLFGFFSYYLGNPYYRAIMRRYVIATLATLAVLFALYMIYGCDFTMVRVGIEQPTPIATPRVK